MSGSERIGPRDQLLALEAAGAPEFDDVLERHGVERLEADGVEVLQVNVGRVCNQTCAHCHVDAGPHRTESMGREVAEQCVEMLGRSGIPTLDITGGAPELNPSFRWLVERGRALGRRVIDRCNLTILLVPAYADLPDFLAAHRVEVVASLPSFRPLGTNGQRGQGVFEKSLEALRRLNRAGYGGGGDLRLHLVHNPVGAFLPASEASLEREYRRELEGRHGVVFDELHTLTNMPIGRFLESLEGTNGLERYLRLLVDSFNPAAARSVMCLTYLSVGWDGTLYDCDFNQMLGLAVDHGAPRTLAELLRTGIVRRRVVTGPHCFGCAAGSGSSCGGTLTKG
ncbi:MAG: arsenosugar biosynthesis radical SAM protein ArsS [Acidobacteriia bacterium]|nr:arsenosugar biosynthesis radical SAM protein ArsS [Terriglobia bacterium]